MTIDLPTFKPDRRQVMPSPPAGNLPPGNQGRDRAVANNLPPLLSAPANRSPSQNLWQSPATSAGLPSFTIAASAQPLAAANPSSKPLNLPNFKPPASLSPLPAPRYNFPLGVLEEISQVAAAWQQELQQVLWQIQAIYLEGPIINGWLEEIGEQVPAALAPSGYTSLSATFAYPVPQPRYRLCGVDEEGHTWFYPCPPEQLQQVSAAIARYSSLQQLLKRKQYLETSLERLAQALEFVRDRLPD